MTKSYTIEGITEILRMSHISHLKIFCNNVQVPSDLKDYIFVSHFLFQCDKKMIEFCKERSQENGLFTTMLNIKRFWENKNNQC